MKLTNWLNNLTTYKPEPNQCLSSDEAQALANKVADDMLPTIVYPHRGMAYQNAVELYGPIVNGVWGREREFMVNLGLKGMGLTWRNAATGLVCEHIYMNRDMTKSMLKAIDNLKKRGLLDELRTFDGCFNIRDVRGIPGQPSCHSYGLAIDINMKENKLGQEPQLKPEVVACFKDAGFDWGGDFKRKDGMHFSYAWEGKHEIIEPIHLT